MILLTFRLHLAGASLNYKRNTCDFVLDSFVAEVLLALAEKFLLIYACFAFLAKKSLATSRIKLEISKALY